MIGFKQWKKDKPTKADWDIIKNCIFSWNFEDLRPKDNKQSILK